MLVYVLNVNGQPLMPTSRCGKVKHLLKEGKAKVVCRCPFTIQLTYECGNYTQPITLGVDSGSKHIGLSATTVTDELYAAEIELRKDIVELLSTRRENRRARRNRKTKNIFNRKEKAFPPPLKTTSSFLTLLLVVMYHVRYIFIKLKNLRLAMWVSMPVFILYEVL